MTTHYYDWTPEAEAKLRDLCAEGLSWPEIGERLCMTASAARSRARKLGLKKAHAQHRWTAEADAKLVELRRKALTYEAIAPMIGCSPSAASDRYRRIMSSHGGNAQSTANQAFAGIRHPSPSERYVRRAVEMVRAGMQVDAAVNSVRAENVYTIRLCADDVRAAL